MKRYAFLFALSSLVFACEQPTQKELRTQQSPLVHGVRDVQQTRGMLDLSKRVGNIHKHSGSPVSMPDDSQSMYRDVSVGFMARATGSMDVTGVYVPGDGSCTVLANDSTTPVEGTGVLSSPSRLTTATHIIEYPAPSFQAKVTFNRDGVYVCDSATGKNPCNTYSHDESTDHFYKQEDDFLLRNRLTAMSMETWARSQTYRGRLRKDWQFVLDDYSNQPYVRINGNNVTIRDIAVLKALDKADGNLNEDSTMINWEENQTWFPTGSFALNKPGIFFDYIDYKEAYETYSNDPNNQFGYDGIVIDDAVIPRYYALSVQQWPLENSKWPGEDPDTGKDNEIQLVSYNAAYINQMVQPSQPNIPRPTFHQDVVGLDAQGMQGPIDTCYGGSYEINKLVTYDGLILTTADVGPGASGGSFLGPNAERSENAPAGNENTKYLTGKKIFGLGVYKGPFGKGVNYRPFADNNWDPPRHDYLVCDDYSVEKCAPPVPLTSSSSNWFETPASYATFNDIPNGLNWPKRDDSYTKPGQPPKDPFNPEPYRDDNEFECPNKDEDDNCISFISEVHCSDPGDCDGTGTNPSDLGQGIEIDESVTNDPVQANKWYKAICFDHASPKRVAGTALVAGVVGSATITEANRNSGTFNLDAGDTIGSLGVICAPPSGISWTDNYGFLRVVGKLIGVGKDRLSRVRPNFHGSLYKFLVEGFESRGNKAENDKAPYPRPKSMKMCPPNYYMSGITYSKNNSNGQIQGISQIWCKRSETNKVSQLNPYGYWASSPKELSFDLEYDNYFAGQDHSEALPRYFNISVSLDQWIGHPKAPSNATSETLKCTAQNRVMTQLQFKYDSNQKMTKIGIGCSKFSYF